ncbi:MAG: hypothetical protein GX061_03355 [Eubacteriaceae bacterium]|nr:hypothetical protein [Eubacteriaceae bacterium]
MENIRRINQAFDLLAGTVASSFVALVAPLLGVILLGIIFIALIIRITDRKAMGESQL